MDAKVIVYETNEGFIQKVKNQYEGLEIVPDDKKSYKAVMEGVKAHRDIRLAIERQRKDNNKNARKYITDNDSRAKELHAINDPAEQRLKDIRQVEDDRIDAIRREKIRQEEQRVEAIQDRIEAIKDMAIIDPMTGATAIKIVFDTLHKLSVTEEWFAEFYTEASQVYSDTEAKITKSLNKRIEWETEQAEAKEKEAALEKQRLEQEAAQKKIDADNKKIQDEKDALAAEKKAEQERKDREEFEKEAVQRAEEEAQKRRAAEAEENIKLAKEAAAEKERQEALRPDKEKLLAFATDIAELSIGVMILDSEEAQTICHDINLALQSVAHDLTIRAEGL